MCYTDQYARKDSNDNQKAQGKLHHSENVPPPVPPVASISPQDASELIGIWSAMNEHQQAELLRVARAMCDHRAALDG